MNLSRFPYDFIIHFLACFLPLCLYNGWEMVVVVLAFMLYLEYEQKGLVGYYDMSWKEYFIDHALRDIIADILGIVVGLWVL